MENKSFLKNSSRDYFCEFFVYLLAIGFLGFIDLFSFFSISPKWQKDLIIFFKEINLIQLERQLSYINIFFLIGFFVSISGILIKLALNAKYYKEKVYGQFNNFKADFKKIVFFHFLSLLLAFFLFLNLFSKFSSADKLLSFGYFYTGLVVFIAAQAICDFVRYVPLFFWSIKGGK